MDIRTRLRAATQDAHERLETTLNLLSVPLSREKFTYLLGRFWGFHTVWEGEIAGYSALDALMAKRGRLALLEADLTALGQSPATIHSLPACTDAAALAASPAMALGSLYVMEGSTLGGQMISRALSGTAWVPPHGLRYFNPYGAETGPMWRGFLDALQTASSPATDPEILTGAAQTFALLENWLAGVPA